MIITFRARKKVKHVRYATIAEDRGLTSDVVIGSRQAEVMLDLVVLVQHVKIKCLRAKEFVVWVETNCAGPSKECKEG